MRRERVILIALTVCLLGPLSNPSSAQKVGTQDAKINILGLYEQILAIAFPGPIDPPQGNLLMAKLRFLPAMANESQINIVRNSNGTFNVMEYYLLPDSDSIWSHLTYFSIDPNFDIRDPKEIAKLFKVQVRTINIPSKILINLFDRLSKVHIPLVMLPPDGSMWATDLDQYDLWYEVPLYGEFHFDGYYLETRKAELKPLIDWMRRVKQAVDYAPTSTPPPHPAGLLTGTASGQIVDAQGKVIPGVAVVISDEISGAVWPPVRSDNAGIFSVADLPPGTYWITVMYSIFRPSVTCDVHILGGETTKHNLTLTVKSMH